jgi:hypothetical protein
VTRTLAWHFLADRDGRPVLRDGSSLVMGGETYRHTGPLVLCDSGLHASIRAIDALTAERDRLANLYDEEVRLTRRALAEHVRESRAQERNLAQELSRADRLSRELDRHIDALASLGHLPDDAEHTRWCEPCRRVREGGGE